MKLVAEYGSVMLPKEQFGSRTLADMAQLYGAQVHRDDERTLHWRRVTSAQTSDGIVRATPHAKRLGTVVSIARLGQRENAARWAALAAYQAKGGVAIGSIMTEVPDLGFSQRWELSRVQAEREARDQRRAKLQADRTILSDDQTLSVVERKRRIDELYAADQRAFEQERAARQEPQKFMVTRGRNSEDDPTVRWTTGRADDLQLGPPPSEELDTHSLFIAHGDSLPDAVHTLAEGYRQLSAESEADPTITVANAVGAVGLGHFDQSWEAALAQRTPLAAGRVMLNGLLYG